MGLIYSIDAVAVLILLFVGLRRGVEHALPYAAFIFVLMSRDAAIPLPGLFDLTTQRIVLAVLAVLYIAKRPKQPTDRTIRTPLKWLLVAHILWCFVSTANSIDPMMSLKKMATIVFEYYLLYFIFYRSITDVRTINKIFLGIVAAIIAASTFGAVEAYNDWTVMEWFPATSHNFVSAVGPESGRDARVTSTFAHAILFGAGLNMGIVLCLYLIKIAQSSATKVFLWCGLLLMFLNIYKTSSRGPWLGLILSLAILLVWDRGRVRKYLIVIGILTAAVCVVRPGVWETIANLYIASFDPESPVGSSYEYRYVLRELVQKAVAVDFKHMLWGYGMESFFFLRLEGELYGKPYTFLSCDSAWLELLIETGYVGLASAAAILLTPVWTAWKNRLRSPEGVQLYLATIMVSYYFMMLSAAMYGWGQTGYILWMIIAASSALLTLKKPEDALPAEELPSGDSPDAERAVSVY